MVSLYTTQRRVKKLWILTTRWIFALFSILKSTDSFPIQCYVADPCDREILDSLAGIVGSNSAVAMDVCLSWVLCVVG